MKGTISPLAAKILSDPTARKQLDKVVNSGLNGTVTLGEKTYHVDIGSRSLADATHRESQPDK